MRIPGIIAMLTMAMVGSAAAQSDSAGVLPAVFMGSVESIVPPDRPGAWTLQVISRGGLTGRGTGDVIIVWDGSIRRASGRDGASMSPEELTSLAERIRRSNFSQWHGSLLSTCNDCFATLIVLTIRRDDGALRTHTAYWDTATRTRMPADVLQIHDLIVNRTVSTIKQ